MSREAADLLEPLRGAVTAFRTLTVLPFPGRDAKNQASSLPWFPIVGLFLGAILWALMTATLRLSDGWAAGAAALALGASVLLTGALHLDGLADWADGFFGARDRQRALAIMKDSRVGAFGVVALIIVLLGQWVALTRTLEVESPRWILAVFVISRAVMVDLAVRLPYARAEGGTGESYVRGGRAHHVVIAWIVAAILCKGLLGDAGLAATVGGWLLSLLLGRWYLHRIGGVTGDLLGASCLLVETVLLFAAASGHMTSIHL